MIQRPPHPQLPSLPDRPLFHRHPSDHLSTSYNSVPASPLLTPPLHQQQQQNAAQGSLRRAQFFSDRPQLPLQYAHPLQRTNSYPVGPGSRNDIGQQRAVTQSEHMLRRKTPNGILNAAYDGTSVEQTERPHAMKHILLPVSDSFDGGFQATPRSMMRDLPIRPQGQHLESGYGLPQPQDFQNASWRPDGHFGPDPPTSSWTLAQPLPQIDSMLNQMPIQGPHMHFQHHGNQPYAFMPPNFQPSFGLTVSNDSGPYGPYWPNGTFVPYRPAALRDMRYYPQHTTTWATPQMSNGAWLNTMQLRSEFSNMSSTPQYQIQQPQSDDREYQQQTRPEYLGRNPSYGAVPDRRNVQRFHGDGLGLYSVGGSSLRMPQIHSLEGTSRADSGLSSGQTTPTQQNPQTPSFLQQDFGPNSTNAQQREKVFSSAHSIYIELVQYLHDTRRREHQSRHGSSSVHHSSGPNIWPRPPRQPALNFSDRSNQQRHRHSVPSGRAAQLGRSGNAHMSQHIVSPTQMPRTLTTPNEGSQPSWQPHHQISHSLGGQQSQRSHQIKTLRRSSASLMSPNSSLGTRIEGSPTASATSALTSLMDFCRESNWKWVDGMLLGGCLAYALGDYAKATEWYTRILKIDSSHVEAMSNLAATMLATRRKKDAENYWSKAVQLRPSYFEAVEHLVGLLSSDQRSKEAVSVIDYVQRFLQSNNEQTPTADHRSERSSSATESPSLSDISDNPFFDFEGEVDRSLVKDTREVPGSSQPGFGSSGYAVAGTDNGRILQLVHAKGNMLYSMGDNVGAAKAFEEAVMVGVGRQFGTIDGLVKHILAVFSKQTGVSESKGATSTDPILLTPNQALETAKLCFGPHGELPGLKHIATEGQTWKAVISTTSNSLLSLAKIFQDGMASNSSRGSPFKTIFGVREILALYYLSLSLQPSPSTANNVGILLASVQQVAPSRSVPAVSKPPGSLYPGVIPGSGIHLALLYYHYGLHLDKKHAHLYTNYGSLLKDIGQLPWAIQMYEQAVQCDPNFDIALANLANAVKDTGRIADAIGFYRRAVTASPDFAEAVCGLANALNSVCGWQGRGGIATRNGKYDRWHVDESGMLKDASLPGAQSSGWIKRVVDLVDKQLADGEEWGKGIISSRFIDEILGCLSILAECSEDSKQRRMALAKILQGWAGQKSEGARIIKLTERAIKRLTWQWYQDKYVRNRDRPSVTYKRPRLPANITIPAAPTVLPFHTFTCPMSAKQIRHISQRNGLRISASTLKAPWLPQTVYRPPRPPNPTLRVGYVSSDFNNHPLAHLMQSVFGLHDKTKVEAFCYATTASDNSIHRKQIEEESPHFYDATTWSAEELINRIIRDGIHILVNLNGYTRGARNEVFAARPAPIQMSFMGFAGTLGAEWCDYLLADDTAVPVDTVRPWRRNVDLEDAIENESTNAEREDWIYGENIIFCRDTFFCCDHRQSAPDCKERQLSWEDEQQRRWKMRKELFPTLEDDAIILGNFNQLYKVRSLRRMLCSYEANRSSPDRTNNISNLAPHPCRRT
jgi:tetratricopeptide (TPR) repeat protein